ncbi:MAG: SprT-like domain-containing protein [Firmicutes bacterium]|nr:SprT-like domain-containing protein [Bacillota bacterium]
MQLQEKIYNRIVTETPNIRNENFEAISGKDLRAIFEIYDTHFFHGFFTSHFEEKKDREIITFRLSNRMTSAGGKTTKKRIGKLTEYEITLSSYLLFQAFNKADDEARVNGLICRSRLEAALRILEHEFIHLYEMIKYGDSACSSQRFKTFAADLFGHTHVKHELTVAKRTRVCNIKPGDKVKFEYNDRVKTGVVYRITKRATVMVKDGRGTYIDGEGKRYSKFYVPLESLTLSSGK